VLLMVLLLLLLLMMIEAVVGEVTCCNRCHRYRWQKGQQLMCSQGREGVERQSVAKK
jgi:hypothetical protein